MVYQLVSLTTLFLRFNRLVIVEAGIGNLRVSQDDFFSPHFVSKNLPPPC